MPITSQAEEHRPKTVDSLFQGFGLVAKQITHKEMLSSPDAMKAAQAEWDSHRKELGTWDESKVSEWSDAQALAKKEGRRVHIGRVYGRCFLRGSELPVGSPGRKYKYRTVFGGDNVEDEDGYTASFNDLGSSPVSVAAGNVLDFYGLLKGHVVEGSDAVRAYPQAPMMGTATWVRIPKDQRPASWAKL